MMVMVFRIVAAIDGGQAVEDKEGLGGSEIHTRNGVIDDEVASEAFGDSRPV